MNCKRCSMTGAALILLTAVSGWIKAEPPGGAGEGSAAPPGGALIASPEPGWPQWRGPRRDGLSTEKGLLQRWPAGGPKLLWKLDGLGRGWSSPIISGNRLYVTGDVDGKLMVCAFDLAGNRVWKTPNGKAWTDSYPGARACCAISEGRLYNMNGHGRVACLDAAGGHELWAVEILERFDGRKITWGLSECLLVDGPRLIVTPGGRKAMMAALDKTNGRTVWASEPIDGDQVSHASPILFQSGRRRVLVNCSGEHGFAVDADSGKLLWTVPLRNQYRTNAATPIFGDGCVFVVTAYTYGACYRMVHDGDGVKAEKLWPTNLDTVTGSGVLSDGLLYASGYRDAKWWFCADWRTGRTVAQQKDLTTGAAVYADGRLYVLAEDGQVALLSPGGEGLQIVSRFALVPQEVHDAWAHPVLLDGRLYLRYHDALWCYDVRRR